MLELFIWPNNNIDKPLIKFEHFSNSNDLNFNSNRDNWLFPRHCLIFPKILEYGKNPKPLYMWSHSIIGLFGIQTWIFGTTFILAIWINSSGGVSSPNLNLIWISLCFFHECKVKMILALHLTEGSDNSPPLKRISSRDSEVCGRKEGYSARRRSSLSHVASFSEWCDHWTLRNLIFLRRVTRSAESRIRMGYSR